MIAPGLLLKRAAPFAIAIGIWLTPVPAGLTAPAWHLFAVFVAAIASVLLGAFPLLTAAMMAVLPPPVTMLSSNPSVPSTSSVRISCA